MFFPESVSRVLKLAFHEISFFSSLYVVSVASTVGNVKRSFYYQMS